MRHDLFERLCALGNRLQAAGETTTDAATACALALVVAELDAVIDAYVGLCGARRAGEQAERNP